MSIDCSKSLGTHWKGIMELIAYLRWNLQMEVIWWRQMNKKEHPLFDMLPSAGLPAYLEGGTRNIAREHPNPLLQGRCWCLCMSGDCSWHRSWATGASLQHSLSEAWPVRTLLSVGGWIVSPRKTYVEVLNPSTCECDLIWKKGFLRMYLRCKSIWGHTGLGWVQSLVSL